MIQDAYTERHQMLVAQHASELPAVDPIETALAENAAIADWACDFVETATKNMDDRGLKR